MRTLDLYILRQLMGPFLFFTTVFTALFWLSSALRVISFVVENGQSGGAFLSISLFLLPQSIQLIIAVAGFAAALFLANQIYNNSELVVIMTAGSSPLRTLSPFALFGLISAVFLLLLTNFITPFSTQFMQDARLSMRAALATKLSQEARFLSPNDDVTVYFGTVDEAGGLGDVFIDDRSVEGQRQTYFSETGQFIVNDDEFRLLLLNGTNQVLDIETGKLATLKFETLSYNLSELNATDRERRRTLREYSSLDLLSGKSGHERYREWGEVHQRLSLSLFAILTPIFGAMALLVSGFRRQGYSVNLYSASAIFILIETVRGNLTRLVNNQTISGWVMYMPVLILLGFILILISISLRNRTPKART